jgi:PAS domain-containing protein
VTPSRAQGTIVHKLFAQQVAKATDESGRLDLDRLAELVGGAYDELDRDRRRTDRSMSLMIEEIDAIHRDLEDAVIERTRELRAREADLQAQNMRFDAAVSNMNQGLVMFDRDARLVSATSATFRCTASRRMPFNPAAR